MFTYWVVAGCVKGPAEEPLPEAVRVDFVTIDGVQEALAAGATAEAVKARALARIDALEPRLSAVISLDRAASGGSGPLAGIPVLVKDNVDVAGLPTTAGSLALAAHVPADDAFVVAELRAAGAVILGKANLSEWANIRSTRSSSGWSAVGGQARNPYATDRSPCGSSSGSAVAVAAGYVPVAIGTETDGSILCPASVNGLVGVKPTVGLVSRDGVVPIASTQDTPGPMAVTVTDAARVLEVIAKADAADPAASRRPAGLQTSYVAGLDAGALQGVTVGVARKLEAGFSPEVLALLDAAVVDLERLGATVVEVGLEVPPSVGADEWEVLIHELRPELNAYLAGVEPSLGVGSLDLVVAWNRAHADAELSWFGQELFEEALGHPDDPETHAAAVERNRRLGPELIDPTLALAGAAVIVAPTTGPAWEIDLVNGDHYTGGTSTITAITGYPAVTVPMGRVHGLPVGLTFLGTAWDEARLLAFAYAYEQGTRHAAPPTLAASAP